MLPLSPSPDSPPRRDHDDDSDSQFLSSPTSPLVLIHDASQLGGGSAHQQQNQHSVPFDADAELDDALHGGDEEDDQGEALHTAFLNIASSSSGVGDNTAEPCITHSQYLSLLKSHLQHYGSTHNSMVVHDLSQVNEHDDPNSSVAALLQSDDEMNSELSTMWNELVKVERNGEECVTFPALIAALRGESAGQTPLAVTLDPAIDLSGGDDSQQHSPFTADGQQQKIPRISSFSHYPSHAPPASLPSNGHLSAAIGVRHRRTLSGNRSSMRPGGGGGGGAAGADVLHKLFAPHSHTHATTTTTTGGTGARRPSVLKSAAKLSAAAAHSSSTTSTAAAPSSSSSTLSITTTSHDGKKLSPGALALHDLSPLTPDINSTMGSAPISVRNKKHTPNNSSATTLNTPPATTTSTNAAAAAGHLDLSSSDWQDLSWLVNSHASAFTSMTSTGANNSTTPSHHLISPSASLSSSTLLTSPRINPFSSPSTTLVSTSALQICMQHYILRWLNQYELGIIQHFWKFTSPWMSSEKESTATTPAFTPSSSTSAAASTSASASATAAAATIVASTSTSVSSSNQLITFHILQRVIEILWKEMKKVAEKEEEDGSETEQDGTAATIEILPIIAQAFGLLPSSSASSPSSQQQQQPISIDDLLTRMELYENIFTYEQIHQLMHVQPVQQPSASPTAASSTSSSSSSNFLTLFHNPLLLTHLQSHHALTNSYKLLRKEHSLLNRSHCALDSSLIEANELTSESKERLQQLQAQNSKLESELNEVRESLTSSNKLHTDYEKLLKKHTSLDDSYKNLQEDLRLSNELHDKLEKQLRDLLGNYHKVQGKLQVTEQSLQALQESSQQQQTEDQSTIQRLVEEKHQLESKLSDLQERSTIFYRRLKELGQLGTGGENDLPVGSERNRHDFLLRHHRDASANNGVPSSALSSQTASGNGTPRLSLELYDEYQVQDALPTQYDQDKLREKEVEIERLKQQLSSMSQSLLHNNQKSDDLEAQKKDEGGCCCTIQ